MNNIKGLKYELMDMELEIKEWMRLISKRTVIQVVESKALLSTMIQIADEYKARLHAIPSQGKYKYRFIF